MKLSQFKYNLPQNLIASHLSANRDDARLMVINRKTRVIEHKLFKDVLDYFEENDVFVRNDTRVFPALLSGQKEKTGASISVQLLRELDEESRLWDVLVDPARKIRIGNKLYFGEGTLEAEVIDNTTSRGRTLRFLFDGTHEEFKKKLFDLGKTPLPDDIRKLRDIEPEDAEFYQTIYAKNEGAVVAPTAGLHFSKMLVKRMELKGIQVADITLHAGVGNFKSIDVEDLAKHKIDSEEYFITEEAAKIVNEAKTQKRKICAIGTTTLKAMESSCYINGHLKPYHGWTNKFIFPPYDFVTADALITNLHAPQSSMMMMVCAFGGYELMMEAYKKAVEEQYHFLTYGDAMLIL
ncbi:MAG: tRNA preQ1(34) S-adenosylmethionine ribosyltransferase-isomerase QueA [Bacteroidales bacterium]|jgi:S-adenosylmethionine:tRNA ribosyltransferase-isomerase|nr:tRNA preQ1(34) S-adenosylmethionine ribosyltransferase-isomerase QueA [Bacteroidales bacterium]MBQ4477195.1 tRNA preQ1(34) S-adenosylmethionine ribosyltransferase-isomerase QueA [Bacteroidales bacterium]MBR4453043.1 tRNA preQ1(34) S-adenosylmethionine ribosyltransferase-isomerase QueA [Bacteroidales bacterium]MCR5555637.1 tRNA preQ1(34) S-adenosylmethionine ribosyltransferase-isomerase QueA [Bacteroidales bacterium]